MTSEVRKQSGLAVIRWLTFLMFMMFAMTTDSVGVIIPEVIKQFHLSMTFAGAFHYAPMTGIAFAGIFLGYLADKLGRKKTILFGLILFALGSYLFAVGQSFPFFITMLVISGVAIGIFKTGALALIGDISSSTTEHTATMNTVEGFFAIGSIVGPALVAYLLAVGTSWKWLYVVAATLCTVLIVIAWFVKYPQTMKATGEPINLKRTLGMMKNPYALGFFRGNISLCSGRMRNLRLDAYPPHDLSRFCYLHGGLRDIGLLCSSRRWEIHRVMAARPAELDCRFDDTKRRDSSLFRR